MIMRRGTMPGQGGNVCDLGRPRHLGPCSWSRWPTFSGFGGAQNQRYRRNGSHDRYL